jgi:NAD(P)-dependent dehydrogenase (short-subunit alcohol dehydrogenase family)
LQGKVALVTGANAGIGKWTAVGLARRGAHVLAAARDPARGSAAVEEIRRRSGSARVSLLLADLSSLEQVEGLADAVLSAADRLDVLVNNAGLILGERRVSVDGFEMTFAVNHLAAFHLTNLLLPRLQASVPARIVNVASRAHARASLDFDDLQSTKGYEALKVYGRSKLANVLFTRELAQRLEGTGVTANSLHPGVVRTDFGGDGEMGAWMALGWSIVKPLLISARKGAETSVHLAASEEVEGISGEYWAKCRVIRPSRAGLDMEAAARLWDESERLASAGAEARRREGVASREL